MSQHILEEKNRVVRHGVLELAEHWTIALSGLVLLLSGLFELPMAARYGITAIPGFAWSGDFITSLSVHYAASVVFIAASVFHFLYHGLAGERELLPQKGDLKTSIAVIKTFFGKGEEPPFEKYLPEQRLAYAGMAMIIVVLILSGLIKTYKNVFAPDLSHTLVLWVTWLHNIFFVLFVLAFIAHIGAILLKPNRPLARGIFTGAVRLDYARHRHPLWLAGMGPQPPLPSTEIKSDEVPREEPKIAEPAAPVADASETPLSDVDAEEMRGTNQQETPNDLAAKSSTEESQVG
jgi:cytochrome b subunit of formate dehydrogenase